MILHYLDCIKKMINFCEEKEFEPKSFYDLRELMFFTEEEGIITVAKIKRIIAEYFGLSVSAIDSKAHLREICFPRQLVYHYANLLTKDLQRTIGKKVGNKSRYTVIHSCKKIKELKETRYPLMEYKNFLELEILFAPFIKKVNEEE